MRARPQFPICDFFTYWVSADARFLSYGCSSRELQCPRAPRSQWLLSQPGFISCPVSVVSVTAQHPAWFAFFSLKHLKTRLTLQEWCLQSRVAGAVTARGASFMCSPALLAQTTPFLMLSWVAVPCPAVPGRAASLRGVKLPFHLGEAGTGKHCPAARHLQGNSCFSLQLGGSRSSGRF